MSTLNFQYQAFGFNLASDIPLPELSEKLLITNEQNSISVVSGNYENLPSIEASPQSITKCSGIWVLCQLLGWQQDGISDFTSKPLPWPPRPPSTSPRAFSLALLSSLLLGFECSTLLTTSFMLC